MTMENVSTFVVGNADSPASRAWLVFAALLLVLAFPSAAMPAELRLERRAIIDPQSGGMTAAVVTLPVGWRLEGGVNWDFLTSCYPARIKIIVKSPGDDTWFNYYGPYSQAFLSGQSPFAGDEAYKMGRQLVPFMSPEEVIREMLAGDRAIASIRIVGVDKCEGNAANRERRRQEIGAIWGSLPGANLRDVRVEEAIVHATFTKGSVPWEAKFHAMAEYIFTVDSLGGEQVLWDVGPVIALQAHAGKLGGYEGILSAMAAGTMVDPVWGIAMQNVGHQMVQRRLDQGRRAIEVNMQQAIESARQMGQTGGAGGMAETNANVMRGWTNTLTGIDLWRGDDGVTHSVPTGFRFGWSGPDRQTVYSDNPEFDPNRDSAHYPGDWSPMQTVPW